MLPTNNCAASKECIERVLQNEPPYKQNSFDLKWYPSLANITELAISSFCQKCNAERVFKASVNETLHNVFAPLTITLCVPSPVGAHPSNPEVYFSTTEYFFNVEMKCAMCGETHYYSILFKGNSLIKIGQYPSYTSLEVQDVRKYKNLIPKYYTELTRSISAYSQGMGVAAFVYLRRILEHLIEKRFTGDTSWKFNEKLHEVEKTERIIPEELETIKGRIYSVLSKGVHEYEDAECMELYLSVKYVIERMLDLELVKKEHRDKATKAIAAINQKF